MVNRLIEVFTWTWGVVTWTLLNVLSNTVTTSKLWRGIGARPSTVLNSSTTRHAADLPVSPTVPVTINCGTELLISRETLYQPEKNVQNKPTNQLLYISNRIVVNFYNP